MKWKSIAWPSHQLKYSWLHNVLWPKPKGSRIQLVWAYRGKGVNLLKTFDTTFDLLTERVIALWMACNITLCVSSVCMQNVCVCVCGVKMQIWRNIKVPPWVRDIQAYRLTVSDIQAYRFVLDCNLRKLFWSKICGAALGFPLHVFWHLHYDC